MEELASNFIADLDFTEFSVSETRSLVVVPLTEHLQSSAVLLGILATMVDVGASHPAMIASRPDWITTQHLSLYGTGVAVDGPIVLDCGLLRVGTKLVVVSVAGYDCHGLADVEAIRAVLDEDGDGGGGPTQLVAPLTEAVRGLITFARIPAKAAPGMEGYDPRAWIGQVRRRPAPVLPLETIEKRMGIEVLPGMAGQLELSRRPYVTNSIGTILGGAQAVLATLAAERLRPDLRAADLQMSFLAQVNIGPAHTRVEVVRAEPDHSVLSVRLVDAGDSGRVLALATVTLTTPPGNERV